MSRGDDLPDRLGQLFRHEASKITSPPDAWERYRADAGRRVILEPSGGHRRAWLGVPAGLVAAAAVIAVVVSIGSGGGTEKSSRAAAGAITVHGGGSSAAAPALAPAAGSAASSSAASSSAASGAAPSVGAGPSASGPPTTAAASAAPAAPAATARPPAGGPVPSGFEPASVTFVSLSEGWVLGTAPCASAPCTSILRTTDAGRTWVGIPAPRTPLSVGDAGSGVNGLRFADDADGWAFGPELWATHDGGATWHAVSLPGVPAGATVMALEASAGSVTAVVTDGAGHLRIETSPVGQDAWVLSPVSVLIGAGPVPSSVLVLQGTSGWMIEVDRVVVGGARLTNGRWQPWTPPCLTGGGPVALAASSPLALVADCSLGVWTGPPLGNHLFVSQDGGTTFAQAPAAIPADGATIASPSPSVAVVGGTDLEATFDGGRTWSTVYRAGTAGGSGFRFVGFTSTDQGVAITGTAGQGSVMVMTHDGGHSWSVVSF